MARTASEKKLIDAIIDGELAAKELIEEAKRDGKKYGEVLTRVSRVITKARAEGSITREQARNIFKESYISLTLAGFAEVAQQVADHSSEVAGAIRVAAKELGEGLVKASPIRKADFLARELEKAGVEGGE